MTEFGGWVFPEGEKHLPEWMAKAGKSVDGRLAYQYKKIEAALSYCTRFRTAIDVGSHVGLWAFYFASRFQSVHAFEPVAAHRECFRQNVTATNVTLHEVALGEGDSMVAIETAPTSSGDSRVAGAGDIPLRRLDNFALEDVDLIKLDCEGFELFALRGGEETIKRWMPVVIVEQKPGRAQRFGLPETGAVEYLKSLGYELAQELSGDFILIPK